MNYIILVVGMIASFIIPIASAQTVASSTSHKPQISQVLSAKIQTTIEQDSDRIKTIFKDLHRHPELAFMEKRTARVVAKELKTLGFSVKTGIGVTGVVGVLRNGEGPTVMYRADMDANAAEETTGLSYASHVRIKRDDGQEVPVAHLCGHDAHVAWMLGMAKAMVAHKADWRGTLILLAQPAEETVAGAARMVDDGLYTSHGIPVPDYLIAMHTAPFAVGTAVSTGGVRMAGAASLDVTFHGVGGHGSTPQYAKDPVLMAATAIVQYQSIISRQVDPQDMAVITVGSVQAGTVSNVIPASALLKINLRWYKLEVGETLIAGIRNINESIARANGMPEDKMPTLQFVGSATSLVNDEKLVDRINVPLRQLLGANKLIDDYPAATASEDVHRLKGGNDIPLAYIVVGVAKPGVYEKAQQLGKQFPYFNHNGSFVVDLAAIPVGTAVATTAVLELLSR